MLKGKILLICGSLNQTTMMHKISEHLTDYDCYFTPYYADGFIRILSFTSLLNFSLLGGQFRKRTIRYLVENNLKIDFEGVENNYDLVFTCSDLIVPKNIRKKRVILVQEGMTDPENIFYYIVKMLRLPRWLASTSTTGLSHAYEKFCVASEGYKELFIRKGVDPSKIEVTGIPNFDNCSEYLVNDFPYKNFVLVATSDARETYKYENRKKFIRKAVKIAKGKQLIFKLHPNEKVERAAKEIKKYAPGAVVYSSGNTEHMIAKCDILITRFSSVVYVGLALGKEVFSEFNINDLKKLMPIQNGGASALNISKVAKKLLSEKTVTRVSMEIKKPRFDFFEKYKLKRRLAEPKSNLPN
ncbi:MAG TPA: hypothetical protein VMT35_06110 [Ignavibacteriaceae bacterium]|nr:hypothetical protein [Ignavibacteriaceae bacterium]